jgi:Uma2 family endonuclease
MAVWDVDPIAELVHVYRHDALNAPTTYGRGDRVEAEAALPGWRLDVDWIFS